MLELTVDGKSVSFNKISVEETLALRQSVLWPEKPISHVLLAEDELGTHYGAFLSGRNTPVAVISLYAEDIPIDKDPEANLDDRPGQGRPNQRAARFRKFACNLEYQGKGIGTQLLTHSLSMARSELDATIAWCDARTATMVWYQKRGLVPFGSVFYKNSVEYIRMKLNLTDLTVHANTKRLP